MREVRRAAMRVAIETGERYRDPYEARFREPLVIHRSGGNPEDPVWQRFVAMREVRRAAMRKAIETGERYRDPYEDRFSPPR